MSMHWIASSGVLDGSTNTVTFSNIPQTFSHLQVRMFSRSARTAQANDRPYFRFNSDSGNNYSWHELYGDGSSAYSQGYSPDSVFFTAITPAATSTANVFSSSVIDILDYSNTNKTKTVRAIDGYDANGSGFAVLHSGNWRSTTAVSSIFIAHYYTGANFVSGSRIDLYGITTSSVTGA